MQVPEMQAQAQAQALALALAPSPKPGDLCPKAANAVIKPSQPDVWLALNSSLQQTSPADLVGAGHQQSKPRLCLNTWSSAI